MGAFEVAQREETRDRILEAAAREGVARLAQRGARQDTEDVFSRAMRQISALLRGLASRNRAVSATPVPHATGPRARWPRYYRVVP